MNTNNLETKNNQLEDYVLKTDESDNGNLLSNNNQDVSHKDSSPKEEQVKFNSLSPTKLATINPIYKKALDFAFSNDDIKNIAITGIYGAGKSTVWNNYVDQAKIDNIITVSLGMYKNTDKKSNNNKSNNNNEVFEVNRIERQLINQILSQINPDLIPLSNLVFKVNKGEETIYKKVNKSLQFFVAVVLLFTRDTIFEILGPNHTCFKILYLLVCLFLLLYPLSLLMSWLLGNDKLKVSKINFKGTEANFEIESKDETVLDRDIKEIVYLLYSSGASVLVFEDLDRYENIEIFTKLRELNYLLNSYIKTNGDGRIVKFVYMIKDGVFHSKDRTKFFDFIIPIVPIVDSITSEFELNELLRNIEQKPDDDVIYKISLYVDDMRLLKNIVNEYVVYLNIIPLKKLELDKNRLFALIVLKNVFPNEFDLLQMDKGFIYNTFNSLKEYKRDLKKELTEKINKISNDVYTLSKVNENALFEAMALMINTDVKTNENKGSWKSFIKNWHYNQNSSHRIYYSNTNDIFDYEKFVNRFIFVDTETREKIEKISSDLEIDLENEKNKIQKLKDQLIDLEISSYKQLIMNMDQVKLESLFSSEKKGITKDHYFPLIRYMIVDGLIDESYCYYKGCFDLNEKSALTPNDTIFIKSVTQHINTDIFFEVNNPSKVLKHLNSNLFSMTNSINLNIIKYCLKENSYKRITTIAETVERNDKYFDLLEIINKLTLDNTKKLTAMLVKNNADFLIKLLNASDYSLYNAYKKILLSIVTHDCIDVDILIKFKNYIEKTEIICKLVEDDDFELFISNIKQVGIKFNNLDKAKIDKVRLQKIEEIQAYKLTVNNVLFIADRLIKKEVSYGQLLNTIYYENILKSTKNYVEENFDSFIRMYINENTNNNKFCNSEEITIKILLSDLSIEERIDYIKKCDTVISDISLLEPIIKDNNIFGPLFKYDLILFSSENIRFYWEKCDQYDEHFVDYVEKNINDKNAKEILKNNADMCDCLINDESVGTKLFKYIILYSNEKINDLNSSLEEERIDELINYDSILVNNENIKVLLNKGMHSGILSLIGIVKEKERTIIIDELLNYELNDDFIYELLDTSISYDDSIKLLKSLKGDILLEKIDIDNSDLIKYIIDDNISKENIIYICYNFEKFKYKSYFIDYLFNHNRYDELDDFCLNDDVMTFILSHNIPVEKIIDLLITKIEHGASIDKLRNYIEKVKEIKDISSVWDGRWPIIDNKYKECIADALIENEYVKERNGEERRIMTLKK